MYEKPLTNDAVVFGNTALQDIMTETLSYIACNGLAWLLDNLEVKYMHTFWIGCFDREPLLSRPISPCKNVLGMKQRYSGPWYYVPYERLYVTPSSSESSENQIQTPTIPTGLDIWIASLECSWLRYQRDYIRFELVFLFACFYGLCVFFPY